MTRHDQWTWVQQRMAVTEARKPIALRILQEWLLPHHVVDIREQFSLPDAEQLSGVQPQHIIQLSASGKRRSGA